MYKFTAKKDFHDDDEDPIIQSIHYYQVSHKAFLPNMKKILRDILETNEVKFYLSFFSKEQLNAIKDLPEFKKLS